MALMTQKPRTGIMLAQFGLETTPSYCLVGGQLHELNGTQAGTKDWRVQCLHHNILDQAVATNKQNLF